MGDLAASNLLSSMKSFIVLSSLVACSLAAPAPEADPQVLLAAKPYINTGAAAGPAHLAFGDLVSTANGLRSLALEGFSEDVDQDGFVDPIAPAVAVAPVLHHAPLVTYAAPVVKPVEVKAPVVTYAHAGLPYFGYHPFGVPLVAAAAPAEAKAEEPAAAVEEA